MTCLPMAKSEIARRNIYVDAGAEPVVAGNIVTVSQRPFYHVWMSSFLELLAANVALGAR